MSKMLWAVILLGLAWAGGSLVGQRFIGVQREAQQSYREQYTKEINDFREREYRKLGLCPKCGQAHRPRCPEGSNQ
jgi:hypothetical protein